MKIVTSTAVVLVVSTIIIWSFGRIGWRSLPDEAPVSQGTIDKRYVQAIDKASILLAAHREDISVPSLSVAVAVGGDIVWAEAVGWADIEHKRVATPKTSFRIGSTSKALTATLTGRLLDREVLDLDTPISTYKRDLPEKWQNITLRQLHSHTAGIVGYEENTDWVGLVRSWLLVERYDDVGAALDQFDGSPLMFPPGSDFHYSSFDVVLASAVQEAATGQSFLDLMQQEVFSPLRMENTDADHRINNNADYAQSYQRQGKRLKPWRYVDLSSKIASGGFSSTSTDLATLGASYLHGDLLTKKTKTTLWAPQALSDGTINEQSYALGWRSQNAPSQWYGEPVWIVHHGGISKGAMSWLIIYPDLDIVIALNTNARTESFSTFNSISSELAQIFFRATLALKQ